VEAGRPEEVVHVIVTMKALIPKRFLKRRWVTLALSRLAPLVAPRRTARVVIDDSDSIGAVAPLLVKWPDAQPRPRVGIVQDVDAHPYWTKYRRFLNENSFPYRILDIHSSSWIEDLGDLDMVVWCPSTALYEIEEARKKIFYMEQILGLLTYPTLRSVTLYEDKVLQSWVLEKAGVDVPRTVVSFDAANALDKIAALGDEMVWKTAAGAGSSGVERLTARQAETAARKVFSARGRKTPLPYANQRGYVYAQALERDLAVDMRVIVVGPLLFGYYRDPPSGDFRASGMGLVRKGALPPEALEEAWRISQVLDVGAVAVDFIIDKDLGRRKVIEFSAYIKAESPAQLVVDGTPGVYVRQGAGRYVFQQGRYWLQELGLAAALGRACGLDVQELLLGSIKPAGQGTA
jgi:hypothetical protein